VCCKELRPVISTELVERDLVDSPIRKLRTQALELTHCVSHQHNVHPQQRTASTSLSLSDQHRDHATQVPEAAAPATQVVMHRSDAVDAGRQLAVVLDDVIANDARAKRRSIGGCADMQAELPGEMFGELAKGRPEQWFAAHPAHQHSITCGALIPRKHRAKARYSFDVGIAAYAVKAPVESTERAAQIAALRYSPDDDHRGASIVSP
jgi:hypothetical protein